VERPTSGLSGKSGHSSHSQKESRSARVRNLESSVHSSKPTLLANTARQSGTTSRQVLNKLPKVTKRNSTLGRFGSKGVQAFVEQELKRLQDSIEQLQTQVAKLESQRLSENIQSLNSKVIALTEWKKPAIKR